MSKLAQFRLKSFSEYSTVSDLNISAPVRRAPSKCIHVFHTKRRSPPPSKFSPLPIVIFGPKNVYMNFIAVTAQLWRRRRRVNQAGRYFIRTVYIGVYIYIMIRIRLQGECGACARAYIIPGSAGRPSPKSF